MAIVECAGSFLIKEVFILRIGGYQMPSFRNYQRGAWIQLMLIMGKIHEALALQGMRCLALQAAGWGLCFLQVRQLV